MGTRPYAWPYDGDIPGCVPERSGSPQRVALVVVGAQAWAMTRTTDPDRALTILEGVARAVRDAGGLVVVVSRRGHGPVTFTAGPDDVMVEAAGTSGFFGSPLDSLLRGARRDRLVIGGLGLETAVYSTMAAANDRGYECLLLADASAPHDPAVGERALSSVTMSGGIFGAVGTSSDVYAHVNKEPSCVP